MSTCGPCWIDGELLDVEAAALRADDSAFSEGRGCYTTARVCGGAPSWGPRHAERLARDADGLGIGRIDPALVLRALEETARAAFREADGVVRVQASRDETGRVHLTAVPRALGDEPESWQLCTAPFRHEGPMPWGGAKVSNHLLFALASDFARGRGVDEAVLLDREGYAIEGARTSLVVVDPDGHACLPDLARGGVAGVARALLLVRLPELSVRNVTAGELRDAPEIVAINAVRGARACVQLDGIDVGSGRPGPWSARLREALAGGEARVSRRRAS
jgi:branched-subunit amino acid aminotransferase/4-amino-4-deoxychorismate lyase